ncbi:MAG: Ig-like domain-containing protein [Lentimicrobiaceae bacterium]|nr:Ig-like domain-containing protein [Lentimicrobiaceae bacterium]
MKNVLKLLSILFLGSVMFASCGKDPVKVTGVALDKDAITLEVGGEVTLVATVSPNDAEDKAVKWESDNFTVAAVSDGKVSGVSVGEATITVKTADGGFSKTCKVTVVEKIEDRYGIKVTVAFYQGGSPISSTMTINVTDFPTTGSVPGLACIASVSNLSGKTIPKGTPYKYAFKSNGTPLEISTPMGNVTVVEGTLEKEVLPNADIVSIGWTDFPINPEKLYQKLGENTMCLEVHKVGKEDYVSPQTDCLNYTIAIKEESAGSPSVFVKNGKASGLLQMPSANDVKSNVVVR